MESRRRTRGVLALLLLITVTAPARGQEPRYTLDTLWVHVGSRASAALPVATRAVEVVTAAEIRDQPGRTVGDVLSWALGVDLMARSPAQADLALRGGTFEQVLVMVDGVRMSDAQTGHFDLDVAVPLDEIERIEILRGAASALYGSDAMGGVVNIVTKRADGPKVTARLAGGSFGTAEASVGAHAGDPTLGLRIAGEYQRSDGHREGTDYRIRQARAGATAPLLGQTLRADMAFAARDFGAADFYAPFPSFEKTRTATASLALEAPADARFAVEPRLSLRRHDDDFILTREDPGLYRNLHTSWQVGGDLVARYAPEHNVRLAVGGEAYRDRLESTNLGNRDERRAAAFAEVAAGRIGHATLTAGVRADWHSEYGTFVAPSLAGAIWPADALRVRASTGRAFRAPTWTERYYDSPANLGDPQLAPERSTNVEIGTDLIAAENHLRISLTGFLRRADALIDWARPVDAAEDAPWQAMNVKDAVFQGLEFEAAVAEFLGARWAARASALSFESEDDAGFTSKYVLRPLTRTVSLEVSRPLFHEDLRLTARLLQARRVGEEAYVRADARLSYAWDDGRVYLDLSNLTDETYLDVSAVPAPGRALYAGISWSR